MSRKMWQVAACNKELARRLADECGIDLLVALILTGRGCTDSFEIEELLSDDQPLGDPYELPDMDKAVECIEAAIHLPRVGGSQQRQSIRPCHFARLHRLFRQVRVQLSL